MHLTRATVTAASRVMLPTYVGLNILVGTVYTFSNHLDKIEALTFQRSIMPMQMWGLVFVALAVVMAAALVSHTRELMIFALCACAVTWGLWSAMYVGSLQIAAHVSPIPPILAGFVAIACVASAISLMRGEVH